MIKAFKREWAEWWSQPGAPQATLIAVLTLGLFLSLVFIGK